MWPEVKQAKEEARRELKLSGPEISSRIADNGLDSTIFELAALNLLNISDSSLEEVPDKISNLRNLQSLVLFGNKIVKITQHIGSLDGLKLLDLSNNMLAEVPVEINQLVNLTSLNLSNNKLKAFDVSSSKKLSILKLSNNQLQHVPQMNYSINTSLSEIHVQNNEIAQIPDDINNLVSLKLLDASSNKITCVPLSLSKMSKLKELNLKDNPLNDKRLHKLIEQAARTKQILDYIKQHGTVISNANKKPIPTKTFIAAMKEDKKDDDAKDTTKNHKILVLKNKEDARKCIVFEDVKQIRPFIICFIIRDVQIKDFQLFLKIQNELHDTVCKKREAATIATHDLVKIKGDIKYNAKLMGDVSITPLKGMTKVTAAKYFDELKQTADIIRKEKKRNTYSGVHKYLNLLENNKTTAYLEDQEKVISLPPLTNCDETKVSKETKDIFVEVTSNLNYDSCKKVTIALIKSLLLADVHTEMEMSNHKSKNNKDIIKYDKYTEMTIEQVRIFDEDGNFRTAFPGKGDLYYPEEQHIIVEFK